LVRRTIGSFSSRSLRRRRSAESFKAPADCARCDGLPREEGKRGGVRVIYYWAQARGEILMLFIYGKDEQDDLTPDQRKQLKKALEAEYP
jgi:hypothetical protein